jgi:hypothetical protein
MPICKTCGIAYLEGESHTCERKPRFFDSARRALFGNREPDGRLRGLRPVLIAWAIALGLCLPLLFMTGELLGPEVVLISLVAFPSGLFSLLGSSGSMVVGESPLTRSIAGWVLYAAVSTLLLSRRRDDAYLRVLILLCILLAANVAGCYIPAPHGDR